MADAVTTTLDTTGWDAFIESLVVMSGTPRTEVLLAETGRVLEICVTRSPGRKGGSKEVIAKTRNRVLKPARYVDAAGTKVPRGGKVPRPLERPFLQTLTGTRKGTEGAQYLVQTRGRGPRKGQPFFLRFVNGAHTGQPISQFNDARFHAMNAQSLAQFYQLADRADLAVASIGSMRKSWIQIAEKLGIELRVARGSFIRKAQTRYNDGARSRVVQGDFGVFLEVVNTNSLLISRYDGASILQGAINQRLTAFRHEIKHDVFADITARAARHPGIFVAE